MIDAIFHKLRSFRENRSGAAMVEFAICVPILLLIIAIIIEGTRITWTHQAAASGVRDAARYFARTTASNICDVSGAENQFNIDDADDNQAVAQRIVTRRLFEQDTVVPSDAILPGSTDATAFSPQIECMSVAGIAGDVPVVKVGVSVSIDFPMGGAFALFGKRLDSLTTVISDESRVFGI